MQSICGSTADPIKYHRFSDLSNNYINKFALAHVHVVDFIPVNLAFFAIEREENLVWRKMRWFFEIGSNFQSIKKDHISTLSFFLGILAMQTDVNAQFGHRFRHRWKHSKNNSIQKLMKFLMIKFGCRVSFVRFNLSFFFLPQALLCHSQSLTQYRVHLAAFIWCSRIPFEFDFSLIFWIASAKNGWSIWHSNVFHIETF